MQSIQRAFADSIKTGDFIINIFYQDIKDGKVRQIIRNLPDLLLYAGS